ncbi:hypothetical protein NMG60_11031272 [Bertholletia excelsa]
MCYEVRCSSCGKTSWGGCGMHVASVYKRIPEGQHCQCKGWPGVKLVAGDVSATNANANANTARPASESSCCIL